MTLYLKDATYIDWKTLAFQSTHPRFRPVMTAASGFWMRCRRRVIWAPLKKYWIAADSW
jgi:hypothetical protein